MAGESRDSTTLPGRAVLALMMTAAVTVGLSSPAGAGAVSTVSGSAFGAAGQVNIVPAGATFTLAPTPLVTLPPGGGAESAAAPSALLGGGPAVILQTGPLTANTEGSTATGIVTSSASATDIGPGVFTASSVSSTCTQTPSGFSGSSEFVNAQVNRAEGPFAVPSQVAPNTEVTGTVPGVNDSFRIIFNEQIVTAGSITVNAVHMILQGPNAIGDVFIGQSVCGADASTSLTCTTDTNKAGTLMNVCTVSDPDGLRSVMVRNTVTDQSSAGLWFHCSDAPSSAKFRVPAGVKYKVVVIDCADPRNKTILVIRANGDVV